MKNMNTIIRSCLKSVPPFLVAEEDITNFLQFIWEKIPRHDDHTKAPYVRRTCLPFSSTMDSVVNKGLKEYTPSTPSPSILTM